MKERILALRAEGKTYRQIRESLGCSLSTISYYCSPVQHDKTIARQRDRRSKNRRLLQEYKQGRPCTDCGEKYPYFVMQFDHISDDKEYNVSLMLNRPWAIVMQEIAKCELVCANCHMFRSHGRLVKHGGDTLEFDIGE
jgi:hypothetical protein